MKPLIAKVRPAHGFSHLAHLALLSLLPIIVFVLVRIDFAPLALTLILLSKWRMLVVKPRFWPAIIRANSIDIIVSVSLLAFMVETHCQMWQLGWTALFIVWLTVIKPRSETIMIALQALIGFLLGLSALFLVGADYHLLQLVASTGLICYLAAHHFFDAFEERYSRLLSYIWGYFGAALVWVLGHWLLYYGDGLIAQPVLLLVSLGYGLAALYYLDHRDKLSTLVARQFIFIMVAVTVIILTFSNWGDKIV